MFLPASPWTFGNTGATGLVDLGSAGRSVPGLTFLGVVGTTIGSTSSYTLTLDNGASSVPVSVSGGTHAINTAIALNSTAALTVTAGQLTLGGNISNGTSSQGLSLLAASAGTLVLGGANGYTGGTSVAGGTMNVTGTLGNTAIGVSGGALSLQNSGAVSQNTVTVSGGNLTRPSPTPSPTPPA